jgi:O-methyltransferase involved in polyketide biosynthesis
MDKINVYDLPPVARTLLAPLACRARESLRKDGLMHDEHAVEIFNQLEGGLDCVRRMGDMDQAFVVMRARRFDRYAINFLGKNPDGLVVDIGCGLDTRFYRLDNGRMSWLGLDIPEAIELRRRFLPDGERRRSFACSMLDLSWLDVVVEAQKPAIFLAEGVFPYFPEADVKKVITALSARFPRAEIAFDALTSFQAGLHNRTSAILKETGARLNWAMDDPRRLEPWGLRLLDRWGFFDDREPRIGAANLMRYVPPLANGQCVLLYRLAR